jgi:hypothetical protein
MLRRNSSSRRRAEEAVVVYIPAGGEVKIRTDQLKAPVIAEWFNPATGARASIDKVENKGIRKFKANDDGDWALTLKVAAKETRPVCRGSSEGAGLTRLKSFVCFEPTRRHYARIQIVDWDGLDRVRDDRTDAGPEHIRNHHRDGH